jgi:hypothetical protein
MEERLKVEMAVLMKKNEKRHCVKKMETVSPLVH